MSICWSSPATNSVHPKGSAFIYVRRGTRLTQFMHGGHQERNRRAGTHNVAGIVGLGKACELAMAERAVHY